MEKNKEIMKKKEMMTIEKKEMNKIKNYLFLSN